MKTFIGCVLLLCLVLPVGAQETPRLTSNPCPFFMPYADEAEGRTLECATLTVPEDHDQPNGKTIDLAVVVIHSTSATPQPDPVIYLEGGPGGAALSGYDAFLQSALRAERDIILLDQRGTGYSKPSLNCWEYDYDSDNPSLDCYNRLVDAGVNLNAYHSAQSALDVADLISVLPYQEVNLWGVSYGTRLALTIMRDTSAPIRSVIIDGVYPPEVQAWEEEGRNGYEAFKVLFDACAADAACNNAYPDLEAVFAETVTALDKTPLTLQDEDGNDTEDTLTGDALVNNLYSDLYDSTMIRYLPAKLYAAYNGDAYTYSYPWWNETSTDELSSPAGVDLSAVSDDAYNRMWADYLGYDTVDDLLAYLDGLSKSDYNDQKDAFETAAADSNGALIDSDSEGFYNTVECYEEVPFNSLSAAEADVADLPQNIQDPLIGGFETQKQDCAVWKIPQGPSKESQPVTSKLPVLVMSGQYDPVTPAAWAQSAASHLPNSFAFVMPGMGHGVVDNGNACPTSIALDFLDDPTTKPDSSCIAKMTTNFYISE